MTTEIATAHKTANDRYLTSFFSEKDLPSVTWTLTSKVADPLFDNTHVISNEVVIKAIDNAPQSEKAGIANMIRKIDFVNGDVNHYLKHLAQALIG